MGRSHCTTLVRALKKYSHPSGDVKAAQPRGRGNPSAAAAATPLRVAAAVGILPTPPFPVVRVRQSFPSIPSTSSPPLSSLYSTPSWSISPRCLRCRSPDDDAPLPRLDRRIPLLFPLGRSPPAPPESTEMLPAPLSPPASSEASSCCCAPSPQIPTVGRGGESHPPLTTIAGCCLRSPRPRDGGGSSAPSLDQSPASEPTELSVALLPSSRSSSWCRSSLSSATPTPVSLGGESHPLGAATTGMAVWCLERRRERLAGSSGGAKRLAGSWGAKVQQASSCARRASRSEARLDGGYREKERESGCEW